MGLRSGFGERTCPKGRVVRALVLEEKTWRHRKWQEDGWVIIPPPPVHIILKRSTNINARICQEHLQIYL